MLHTYERSCFHYHTLIWAYKPKIKHGGFIMESSGYSQLCSASHYSSYKPTLLFWEARLNSLILVLERCRKKAMNIRPTYYKSWCLRTSRPACNSAQCYDAIMSAHVLMMALLKSEKIQVCLKAWSLVWQPPQGLLHTPGWWSSDMKQKKQLPSQWGGWEEAICTECLHPPLK